MNSPISDHIRSCTVDTSKYLPKAVILEAEKDLIKEGNKTKYKFVEHYFTFLNILRC